MFGMNFDLPTVLTYVIILVIGISLHEFAHAKVADMLGDTTPRMHGRVTLNPLSHLDPIGSLMMVIAHFGWGRPVPINPYALTRRTPAGVMWVSLAGPMSNVLLALLGAIPLRLGITSPLPPQPFLPSSQAFFTAFVFTNLFLALFNLIPLAPLDGDKILDYFMPPSVSRFFDTIRPYGPMILILLLFIGPTLGFDLIGQVVVPPVTRLMRIIIG
jgi:Zn-dependent protease